MGRSKQEHQWLLGMRGDVCIVGGQKSNHAWCGAWAGDSAGCKAGEGAHALGKGRLIYNGSARLLPVRAYLLWVC